jgi:transposase-like protein
MEKRCSANQWAVWVAEQRESALNVRDFCDWIGLSQNAFYQWRRKLAVAPSQKPGTSKKFPTGARFASSVR